MDNGRSNHIHARKDTRSSSLKHHLGAIAIVFDFMNPVLPLWRLIDRGSKLGLAVNNLFDNHSITGISPGIKSTSAVPFAPSGGDLLTLLPGRSVMATLTVGFAPKR